MPSNQIGWGHTYH